MKLGARIIKTGLAVVLSLYIAIWTNLEPPTFAALAAAFAVQPSIYRTFQTILEQVQANIVGAVLAVLFVMSFGQDPFVIGLVVALTIAIILKAKLESSTIPLAIVTVIIVMESPVTNFIQFATERFILILIGVVAAFIINLLFIPPRYETKLHTQLTDVTDNIHRWIMLVVMRNADHIAVKNDIEKIEESIVEIETLYLLYKEERNYFLRNKYAKARKVVLFRQMILSSKEAFHLLRMLKRHSEQLHELPPEVYRTFEQHLHDLTTYHNLILLRYAGKVHSLEEHVERIYETNEKLITFLTNKKQYDDNNPHAWLSIFTTFSITLSYKEQLQHINDLVTSYVKFHQQEDDTRLFSPTINKK